MDRRIVIGTRNGQKQAFVVEKIVSLNGTTNEIVVGYADEEINTKSEEGD